MIHTFKYCCRRLKLCRQKGKHRGKLRNTTVLRVKDLLYRARHKQEKVIPKQRGRKPAKTLAEYKYENKRLKMENELLRDFLQSIERKWGPNSNTRWYTGIEQNIPCPSCADFLVYPAAAIMILFAVQTGLRKIKNWPISLPGSANDVGALMVIAGCGYG